MIRLLTVMSVICIGGFAQAQVYKCVVDGKTVYQGSPCAAGVPVVGDTPWDRERKREEALKEQRDQQKRRDEAIMKDREGLLRMQMQYLKSCKETECDADLLGMRLRGLSQEELTSAIGEPNQVQRLASGDLWYFAVPIRDRDGLRTRRVQIGFGHGQDRKTQRSIRVVETVNIY